MKKFITITTLSLAFLVACTPSDPSSESRVDPTKTQDMNDTPNLDQALDQEENDMVTDNASASSDLSYTDAQYGFHLNFPETWKGYLTAHHEINFGGTAEPIDSIHFGLPLQASIFSISIFTPEQWKEAEAMEGVGPTALGKDGTHVYAYQGYEPADSKVADRRNEVQDIVKTFTVK